MNFLAWIIFVAAALLEVCGDASIRTGLRARGILLICLGMTMLGTYGIVVNLVKWDFSKLLGVYVGVFAVISVLFGRIVFHEQVPLSTWLGLVVMIVGAMIIQLGSG